MSMSVSDGSREQTSCLCVSQVGLVSSRLHGTFTAVPSQSAAGTLALVRRCQPVTCEGHCTCAPHGQLTCASTGGCVDVKGEMMSVTSCHVTTNRLVTDGQLFVYKLKQQLSKP